MKTDYRKTWPVQHTTDHMAQLRHYESMLREHRAQAARREFCDTQSLKLAAREAKDQRTIARRAITALRRIALLATERDDHELHVMAIQGLEGPICK